MDLNKKSKEELQKLAESVHTLQQRHKFRLLDFNFPETGKYARSEYPKAMEFFKAGSTHRFRVLAGANGVGKSHDGASELAYHATGEYPDWWEGLVLKRPKLIWVVTESPDTFKSSLQKLLLGPSLNEEDLGTGLIPKERIVSTGAWGGVSGAVRTIEVRHKKGHIVTIEIKSFEQESSKLESANVDFALFDEEPPLYVYTAVIFRLRGSPTKPPGKAVLLFTSLKGLTDVVMSYAPEGKWPDGECPHDPDKYVVRIEMDEVPHLTDEDKRMYLANCPPHQLESRTKGLIQMGSGRIYPYLESQVFVEPFSIPDYWVRAFALDFGNITACLWGAKDPHTNVLYIYEEYYHEGHETAKIHALNILSRGNWIPGICDPSGGGKQNDGRLLMELYKEQGLSLRPGENAIATGIARNCNMFQNGTIKIFNILEKTKQEFRTYRWDSKDPNEPARGQKDHAMDALKYLTSLFDRVSISKSSIDNPEDDDPDYYKRKSGRNKLTGY